jgi:AcrR family transcriptional regulator
LKARRADAARNQASIVRAARKLMAAVGPDVGMDEIAREAGVAVGTLYRHFPTKTDLVNAIVADHLEAIVTELEAGMARVDAGSPALPVLTGLLEWLAASVGEDHALKAAATNLGSETVRGYEARAMATLHRLVAAAQREGSLYPDVTAADLALLVSTLPGDEVPAPARRRWIQLALRAVCPPRG